MSTWHSYLKFGTVITPYAFECRDSDRSTDTLLRLVYHGDADYEICSDNTLVIAIDNVVQN